MASETDGAQGARMTPYLRAMVAASRLHHQAAFKSITGYFKGKRRVSAASAAIQLKHALEAQRRDIVILEAALREMEKVASPPRAESA